jgi:hypothetical protein
MLWIFYVNHTALSITLSQESGDFAQRGLLLRS